MNKKEHLPTIGVGPIIVIGQLVLTMVGVILSCLGIIKNGRVEELRIVLYILGTVFILCGLYLWFCAVIKSQIDDGITSNQLITTGIYSYVRNPIYSAFFFMFFGIVCIVNNLFLFVIPVLNWIYMTLFLKQTEEKWLYGLYGKEYLDYCRKVNRCIPWFKKNK